MLRQLSHQEAQELMANGNIVIADVRDDESYSIGHISSAVHMTMAALKDFCENAEKEQPILLYCYHGISSQSVAQHLIEQGFTEVYSLVGGFETWKEHHPTSSE